MFLHTNLPYFVKRPRAIVIDWALYKYFYYYYYIIIDINKDGVGHVTKRMLPTDAKELVHLTCYRVRVYIYHAKIFI